VIFAEDKVLIFLIFCINAKIVLMADGPSFLYKKLVR